MLFRVVSSTLALALLASATILPRQTGDCSYQCCDAVIPLDDPLITQLAGTLGINLSTIVGDAATGCRPIPRVGFNCAGKPLCCAGNRAITGIQLGCNPVNPGN
ncbi:hypothetical protein BDN72DRAFT_958219 [Pluteus cervinus]|uniref:Uncharacterized protein n=1 Tax=Pluteus cervinus TaxID=181527 RepID=A0ACD3B0K1_9AGAR|nr:hypothetical protein BDN72DRAFT_958219 [Pluteus cervinus]